MLTFSGEEKEVQKTKGLIEEINAIIIVKCRNGSPITRLEKESKKLKICGNGGNSELIIKT